MKLVAVAFNALLAVAAAQMAPMVFAQANRVGATLPVEVQELLPQARLAGRVRLSVWGFQIYDATLWVAPGFNAETFQDHGFALELAYLRSFSSDDIANRSLGEMGRQRQIPADKAAFWERQLRDAIPDVKPGDRLTGLHRPGEGASFLVNGKLIKTIRDAEFARRFFGIWLADTTSEPAMRRELLSMAKP
jgi:hypothetical protein